MPSSNRAAVWQAAAYVEAIEACDAIPLLIPVASEPTLRRLYAMCDAILLPGGPDLDPAEYGAIRDPATADPEGPTDHADLLLARWAIDDDKPLLGVCRGLQVIAVTCGSRLTQDLSGVPGAGVVHRGPGGETVWHDVDIVSGTRLAGLAGAGSQRINSRHHQGVAEPGLGLVVAARSHGDGIIEAIELPGRRFVMAVQWHPEELLATSNLARALFATFCEAARQQSMSVPAPLVTPVAPVDRDQRRPSEPAAHLSG